MGKTVDTFDFLKASVIIDSTIATEYMDGEPISVAYSEDSIVKHVGADGSVTLSESNDTSGDITITLKMTSPTVRVLRKLWKDKQGFPITITDNNSKTRYSAAVARVTKYPDTTIGTEITGLEFAITAGDLKVDDI